MRSRFSIGLLAGLTLGVLATALPASAQTRVFKPGAKVNGKKLSQWGDAWWKLTYETPAAQNQIVDPDGSFGDVGQHGPVYFLFGTFGGDAERWVTVSDKVKIFFPLINSQWDPYPFGDPNAPYSWSVDYLRELCAGFIDATSALSATVDGVSVTDLKYTDGTPVNNLFLHREPTGDKPFSYRLPGNFVDAASVWYGDTRWSGKRLGPAVQDGYWLMLKPLKPGHHTIAFSAAAAPFGFALQVTYHLNVVHCEGDDED